MNLHENREVFEEVQMPDTRKFSKYRKAYYRYPQVATSGNADLAYRPLPESEEVVASFKTIVRLLLK